MIEQPPDRFVRAEFRVQIHARGIQPPIERRTRLRAALGVSLQRQQHIMAAGIEVHALDRRGLV